MAMMIFFIRSKGTLRNGVYMDEIYLEKNANLYWIYRYNLSQLFSSDLGQFFAYRWSDVPPILWIFFSLADKDRDFYAFALYYCLFLLLLRILMWLVRALWVNYQVKLSSRMTLAIFSIFTILILVFIARIYLKYVSIFIQTVCMTR